MGIPLDCDFQEIQDFYNGLEDEKSKRVFMARLMYNITGDTEDLRALIACGFCLPPQGVPLVLFGVGKKGGALPWIYPYLKRLGYQIPYIWDNNSKKWNRPIKWELQPSWKNRDRSEWEDLLVLPPQKKAELENPAISVAILPHNNEEKLKQQLFELGFAQEQIYVLRPEQDPYFNEQIFANLPESFFPATFVDGGAYDGVTSMQFKRWCEQKCGKREAVHKIYAFEPDPTNFEVCRKYLAADCGDKAECINKGMWDRSTTLHFFEAGGMGSRFSEADMKEGYTWTENTIDIPVVALDDVDIKVSNGLFIKVDVEGSDWEAWHGAERTVLTHRPILAVCIYHKAEDIFTLSIYLKRLLKDYKFYLRHCELAKHDTILYAVPAELC